MTTDYTEKLHDASDFLRGKWIQKTLFSDDKACMHGAVHKVCPTLGQTRIIRAAMDHWGLTIPWNDAPDRTENEVCEALLSHTITDETLEEVLGPQWKHLEALVSQTPLSKDLQDEMYAEAQWIPVEPESRGPDPAWDRAYDAAKIAGVNEAGRTELAWFHSPVEQGTELALMARDLIGKSDFTQEHYDFLTMPWRKVVGPIHPDDEDPR